MKSTQLECAKNLPGFANATFSDYKQLNSSVSHVVILLVGLFVALCLLQ